MNKKIRLNIGGDLCPNKSTKKFISIEFLSKISTNIFNHSDLSIVNLECPLTTQENCILKTGPCLKAHPNSIKLLTSMGIQLVTLANNHIRDYGDAGVCDTLELCSAHGIDTVGAGESLDKARKTYYRKIKGRCLAIINVAENEFANARREKGGANPFDIISLIEDIRESKKNADHVLLIMHGGLEHVHYPSPQSVRLLRFLADQGLTAIIRHHPHTVQGYEVWKGTPIFYSLGNFLFFPRKNPRLHGSDGIVVSLIIYPKDDCTFQIHPLEKIKNEPAMQMLEGDIKTAYLERLEHYSSALHDPVKLQNEWHKILKEKKQDYLGLLSTPSYFLFRVARKLNFLSHISPTKRTKIFYENYLRCEAHREALLDILEIEK